MTEQEYRDKVYAEAEQVKELKQLAPFVESLSQHQHDYGTIVYACCAAMRAAFKVVNESEQGGITGFQAGCIMWEMVKKFGQFGPDAVLRIQNLDDLRYPQMDGKFTVKLDGEQAQRIMATAKREYFNDMHPDVKRRHEEVARGQFPPFVVVEP